MFAQVVIGGGKRDPISGWVASCDLQRRGGGSDSCAVSTDYRLDAQPGNLTIVAGSLGMHTVTVDGNLCIGMRCGFNGSAVNATAALAKGRLGVKGSLHFANAQRKTLGLITPVGVPRTSVEGACRIGDGAVLLGGAHVTGRDSSHARLHILGSAAAVAPVQLTQGPLQVAGTTSFARTESMQLVVHHRLTVCSLGDAVACAPQMIVDASASSTVWANGSARVQGQAILAQDVSFGSNNASVLEIRGRVQAVHGLVAEVAALAPRLNRSALWFNGSLINITFGETCVAQRLCQIGSFCNSADATSSVCQLCTTCSNGVSGCNDCGLSSENAAECSRVCESQLPEEPNGFTVVPIYGRNRMQVASTLDASNVHVRSRYNRSYVDMDWSNHQDGWRRDDTVSSFTVAGSSSMGSLSVAGLLRIAPSPLNASTLVSANPGAGDAMVQESLTTKGHSVVHGAEFGPVQLYSYWIDFENATVYNWTERQDPRCFASAMPAHVCEMAQHWAQYECFSTWRPEFLDRVDQCTLKYNATRAYVQLRVPLEEIYVQEIPVSDQGETDETLRVPLDPPVFLRALAPANTAIRSMLRVNGSGSLRRALVDANVNVASNLNLHGSLMVSGHATLLKTLMRGKLFGAHMGHLKFSAVPDVDGGGLIFTYGSFEVRGPGMILRNMVCGKSSLDSLAVAGSVLFNNTVHTQNVFSRGQLTSLALAKLESRLSVRGNVSLDNVSLVGNLVFETAVYRTFTVEAWANRTRAAGNVDVNESVRVDTLVSSPSLAAGTLYIAEVNGTSPAGTLLEGVYLRSGGISRPRVDNLQSQTRIVGED